VLAAACTGGFATGSIPESIDRTLAALPHLQTTASETRSYRSDLDVRATGTYDAKTGRYRLAVRFPKLPRPGDPGATSIELPRRYDVIVDSGTVYVRARSLGARFDTRRPWLKADTATADPLATQLLLTRWAPYDPVAIVQTLRGIAGDLKEIGTETIDGTKQTHFRGTLDIAAAVRTVPPEAVARVTATADELRARFGVTTFPVDLWVDDDGLIRRVRFALAVDSRIGTRSPTAVTFTVDLSKVDAPTTVAPPPAERVADVTHATG
jgi:hypothetical protein